MFIPHAAIRKTIIYVVPPHILSSRSGMNKMEHGGENVVPVALPLLSLNVFRLKLKILFFKTILASFTSVSTEVSFSVLKSRCFFKNDELSSWEIFGFRPITSKIQRIASFHGLSDSLKINCENSVQIRSFFWSVFSCIRTEKTPYFDTFHAVISSVFYVKL